MNTMNIEVINMYFYEKDLFQDLFLGTAHIRLIDYNIDLKGVYFKKRKNYWIVSVPALISTHPETKKKVRYPLFSFPNKEKNRAFQMQVRHLLQKALYDRLMQRTIR